jgi:hypothetical protein
VILLLFGVSSVGATVIDLTGTGTDIYNFQGGTDGSLWRVIQTEPTGTGVYQPFLRYQESPAEIGLNTDLKPPPYDDKMPATKYTRSVLFADLGVVDVGGTNYWSFTVDFNEPGTDTRFLSFDNFDIYQGSVPNAGNISELGLLFDSADTVLTDYWLASSGSGKDDIEFLIPVQAWTEPYMYLFIQSGAYDGIGEPFDPLYPEGRDWTANAGFEEIRTTGISPPAVPEPATMLLFGSGLIGLGLFGRKRFKK